MHKLVLGAALAALLALAPSAAFAEGETPASPQQSLIDAKADTVVSVKIVLDVRFNFRGQTGNREFSQSATGIVVDAAGLVMIPSAVIDPDFPGAEVTSTPTSIRVIFPGDDKEYPAILGAKDSKLGLAFVLIKDLGEKKPTVVDFGSAVEPKIGDTLYGVSRMGQGFDYAPICSDLKVIGKVTQPRTMWALSGTMQFVAEPLYTASGAAAGVGIVQAGVGGEGGNAVFLLPLKIAAATVKHAHRDSEQALDEILEAEEEAAANAAEESTEESTEGDGEKKDPADGEKKDGEEKKDGDGQGGGE